MVMKGFALYLASEPEGLPELYSPAIQGLIPYTQLLIAINTGASQVLDGTVTVPIQRHPYNCIIRSWCEALVYEV